MSFLVHNWRLFHDWMERHGDPYTSQWFLMSSPFPTIAMSLLYVYIVKRLGPHMMKDRKPFNLKKTLIVYNLTQVALSAWLFYEAGMSGWFTGDYNWRCQPVDRSASPLAMRMRRATWWNFFSKFTEFFDTFFFVVRKKYRQVSALHVIHHGIMPLATWYGVKFLPGGHGTFFGLVNTFVHVIMYSYYLLAGLGPQVQRYLWWKKYLTAMQLAQFTVVTLHATQILVFECDFPKYTAYLLIALAIMFFVMFKAFYAANYATPKDGVKSRHGGSIKQNSDSDKQDGGGVELVSNGLKQNGDCTTALHRRTAAGSADSH